jgi:hypothetical protein
MARCSMEKIMSKTIDNPKLVTLYDQLGNHRPLNASSREITMNELNQAVGGMGPVLIFRQADPTKGLLEIENWPFAIE